jgi:outer membrane receptor protein involved in Fe transport
VLFPTTLLQNSDQVKTTGIFASGEFDFTDSLTGILEGRYQKDTSRSAILTPRPFEIESKKFLPRAILRWQPSASTNVYASYAKGLLPGIINTQIATATPRELAQYQSQFPGTALPVVEGDELDMFEIGWKQRWREGRASTNIAAYYGQWDFQKGRSLAVIQEDCGSPSHPATFDPMTGLTTNGCPGGNNGAPAVNANGTPFLNSRNFNVAGNSKIWGVEFEGALLIADRWDSKVTLTYAKSEYSDFTFNFVAPIAQFTQMRGNSNARFPEWSGSFASGYTAPLRDTGWEWFVNGDISYFGKAFVDESNLAQCDAYSLANVRIGAEKDNLRLEGFVRNVFDDDSWAACARWTDFDNAPSLALLTAVQGVAVTPQNPRQYGIRLSVKF